MKKAGSRARTGTPRMFARTLDLRSERRYSGVWTLDSCLAVDRRRPREIAGLSQPTRDQGIINAAVLEAVEGVEAFQTEGRDVVLRVIDDRDHNRGADRIRIRFGVRGQVWERPDL